MVIVEGLSLTLGEQKVLTSVDFCLNAGEHLGILGPNGAGKTSLLRLIAGDLKHQSGDVKVFGRSPHAMPLSERARQIAMLSQRPDFNFPFKIEEIIALGRYPFRGDKVSVDDLVWQIIEALELEPLVGRSILTLSGGERQRVHIARAIAQVWDLREPGLLLLDEPFSALDVAHQVTARRVLESMRQRLPLTLISVVHDLHGATRVFDQICLLGADGDQAGFGSPFELLSEDRLKAVYGVEVQALYFSDGQLAGHTARASQP